MSDDRKDLPAVSSDNFLQRVREALQTYMGSQGNVLDRGVTLRDLSDTGLIDLSKSYLTTRRGSPVAGPGPAAGGATPVPDLTPPPTPTGFTVGAGISHLFIGCAPPTYSQGHGHLVTRLYGTTRTTGGLPVFADAVALTEFQGTAFAHPTNPATTWHLWITWVTRDGVESAVPAGGTNGLSVTTGQDVSSLLAALAGRITQSQLYADLGARIDLIDGSGAGSVNARLSTEASTRATQTGELYAKYTVKVDVAGLISGYGLASTANNAAPTSSFGVRANSFFVAPPAVTSATAPTTDLYDGYVWLDTSVVPNVTRYRSGAAWVLTPPVLPFVVQATPTTVNGESVPAGVYANDLFVKNGTITNAKIANLAVDDAKIANLSVSKLTAGSLAVGQYVQSTNYVPNVSGWQWRADGSAELGSQYIRGKLTAAQIDASGLDIKDAAGNVILSSGSTLQAQIAPYQSGATVGANGSNVGGGNLVLNAGFGAYSGTLPMGWNSYNNAGISVTHSNLTGLGLFGTNAHRVTANASTTAQLGIYTNLGSGGGVRAWTVGREHVISFYARASSAGAVGVQMQGLYSNMQFTGPVTVANPGLVLGVWQRYIFRGVPNNNAYTSTGELLISWDVQGTLPAGASFDICAVQVQSGDFATEWAETAISARNPINSANASTYIADLAVNTLQIANNAVTVPTSANAEDTVTITPEGGYVLFAPTINSQGGMTTILVGVSLFASNASLIFGVRVYRNGAFLKEFESSGSANHFATFVLTDVFNGDASYGLFIYKKYSALLDGSVRQRTLIVSGAKR